MKELGQILFAVATVLVWIALPFVLFLVGLAAMGLEITPRSAFGAILCALVLRCRIEVRS